MYFIRSCQIVKQASRQGCQSQASCLPGTPW